MSGIVLDVEYKEKNSHGKRRQSTPHERSKKSVSAAVVEKGWNNAIGILFLDGLIDGRRKN